MRTPYLLTLTLALACTAKGDGSTTDETTTDPASSTTSDDPSTTGTPTTGPDAPTSSTGDATTGDATTGGVEDAICAALCAHEVECDSPFAEGCLENCAQARAIAAYPGEACLALQDEIFACQTAASCQELLDPGASPCEAENNALISDACTSEQCDAYAARLFECNFIDEDWQISRAYECTYFVAEASLVSAACLEATEASIACVSGLTCEQIDAGDGCDAEEQASDEACL
ncbi:hypothetical protein [Nannocystis pusilla]|uniref:Uncharacterized protein n=1 Tax=Nannocystis pusilla TaxID=889268 RepID=A0ABS7TIU5_9BACT|nr:hypothetical protein [Nannocystis pusilla]MBZ5708130.1 hypothetical protein [Nannocystis pusilla]